MKTIVPSPARIASHARRRDHVADLLVKVGNHLTTILCIDEDVLGRDERSHISAAVAALSQALETIAPPWGEEACDTGPR